MNTELGTAEILEVFSEVKTIAVIGLGETPSRQSNDVGQYLRRGGQFGCGWGWQISMPSGSPDTAGWLLCPTAAPRSCSKRIRA